MNTFVEIAREEVAVRHLATSAQPPRATLVPATKVSSPPTLHPIRSSSLPDTPGALLEGLRCFPTACPLPLRLEGYGKPPTPQEINSGIKKIVLDVMAMLFRKHEVLTCKT